MTDLRNAIQKRAATVAQKESSSISVIPQMGGQGYVSCADCGYTKMVPPHEVANEIYQHKQECPVKERSLAASLLVSEKEFSSRKTKHPVQVIQEARKPREIGR